MKHYDIAVIGGGSGLVVADNAVRQGRTCAIIERAKFGGTCLNRGCIPSKMLVYPADFIRQTQQASRIGLDIKPVGVNFPEISARVFAEIGKNVELEEGLKLIENLAVYKGTARFTTPHTLAVDLGGGKDEEISADAFVIATGGRTFIPPVEGLETAGYVASETFFGEKFPKKPYESLLILGGGAIGAEFAHIFSAFGTKVTIIEMKPRLLATEEEEVSAFVSRQFERDGIRVLANHRVVSAHRTDTGKGLTIESIATGEMTTLEAQEIFVASGIRSNADTIDLGKANVAIDPRGYIVTDEYLRTSQPHIYAIGDANGKFQFRHKANYEAGILSHNLFSGEDLQRARYDSVPWAIYTHPQVAHVGMTEKEAKAAGHRVMVGMNTYAEIAGGIAMGYAPGDKDNGFVKLIVCEQHKILGAHVVGPYAALLLQPFVYMMNAVQPGNVASLPMVPANDATSARTLCPETGSYTPMFNSMVIHPSLNELTAWVIEKLRWSD